MKSPWNYEAPTIEEDVFLSFGVHPRGSSKSFKEMCEDFIRYVTIMDDTLQQPITDTFLWHETERDDDYVGTI